MAAKVPTNVKNLGKLNGLRIIKASFDGTVSSNDIDNADTWASGIKGIVFAFFAPTTTTGDVACAVSGTTITFACSASNQIGNIIVFAR